jgi:hypothetical protein
VRYNDNQLVVLPVIPEFLFDLLGSQSDIQRALTHLLSMHEIHYAAGLLVVVFALNFFQNLEVSRLIFKRIILNIPKLALGFDW